MNQSKEPIYGLPASLLNLLMEHLGDPDTKGSIPRGAILIGGFQQVQKNGPIQIQANGKDEDAAAAAEAKKLEEIKRALEENKAKVEAGEAGAGAGTGG